MEVVVDLQLEICVMWDIDYQGITQQQLMP